MSDIEIIKLVFGIMLSVYTVVLFVLAYALAYKYMVQEERCTARTKGIIQRYTFASRGNGIFLPVVFYTVNGKEYKLVGPEYRMYKTVVRKSPVFENETEYGEESQVFIVNRTVNAAVGIYHNPMKTQYPLYSEIDVYYDPNHPKLAYVLRYCNLKWIFYALFFAALFTLMLDMFVLFIL
jgi:hypothetical protein